MEVILIVAVAVVISEVPVPDWPLSSNEIVSVVEATGVLLSAVYMRDEPKVP